MLGLISALLVLSMLAGCGASNTPTIEEEEKNDDPVAQETVIDTDVVVLGGGAAGLSAALEAANEGVKVTLLEKLPMLGGSTLLSGGIMYAAESPVQKRAGVEGNWEDLADYWIEMAEGDIDEEMIRFIAENSGETISWLESHGVEFSEKLSTQGISPALRGHTSATRGQGFINPLEKTANENGVVILKSTKATKLLTDQNGNVIGTEAEDKDGNKVIVNAKSVIIATGGFDRNPELLNEYSPIANGQIYYVSSGNTGDGLIMAREVGADIVSKNGVIGFRGVAENLPYTIPLGGLVFVPNLYVDGNGERFMNEANHYALMYKDMMANETGRFYSIFSGENAPAEILEEGIEKGYVFKGESIEELAKSLDVHADKLKSTIERFNELAQKGIDEDFGNAAIAPVQEGTLYALKVSPATLGTFGGPRVNLNGEVLNTKGEPIIGLYAVGEVANGQLYKDVYPASGTSITSAFVLGRVTGIQAAKAAK